MSSNTRRMARLLDASHRAYRDTWNRHGSEPRRECEPTYTLNRQVADARAEMGEDRWAELQKEWSNA